MMSSIIVLGGVGVVCVAGVAVSSAMKFFLSYEYDVAAKMKDSKKTTAKKEMGGAEHGSHMERLSRHIEKR